MAWKEECRPNWGGTVPPAWEHMFRHKDERDMNNLETSENTHKDYRNAGKMPPESLHDDYEDLLL